ncbi:MAG: hypothetical protein ACN4GZ_15725, partial [Acidimicrobiales bacterium]
SEAVYPLAEVNGPEFAEATAQDQMIIDESERLFSAGELYTLAFGDIEESPAPKSRPRLRVQNVQRIQLWGAGTSGVPRRGSRTIRLFKAEPDEVFAALRHHPFGQGLRLDPGTFRVVEVLDDVELHAEGVLLGAFALRSSGVAVTLRAARFNAMFTAVEIRLNARRHPRRFFRAAHDSIQSLPIPGRT